MLFKRYSKDKVTAHPIRLSGSLIDGTLLWGSWRALQHLRLRMLRTLRRSSSSLDTLGVVMPNSGGILHRAAAGHLCKVAHFCTSWHVWFCRSCHAEIALEEKNNNCAKELFHARRLYFLLYTGNLPIFQIMLWLTFRFLVCLSLFVSRGFRHWLLQVGSKVK